MHGIKDLVARIEDTPPTHRQIARTHLSTTTWYAKLDSESQKRLADYGRQLLDLVVSYITTPRRRTEITALVRKLGHEFGRELARQGLTFADSLEAFLLHRNPVANAATDLLKRGEVLNERAVEAIPMVTHIIDEALVSLMAAHQSYRKTAGRLSRKGATR